MLSQTENEMDGWWDIHVFSVNLFINAVNSDKDNLHRIIESTGLENTFKMIKSSRYPRAAKATTKPCHTSEGDPVKPIWFY